MEDVAKRTSGYLGDQYKEATGKPEEAEGMYSMMDIQIANQRHDELLRRSEQQRLGQMARTTNRRRPFRFGEWIFKMTGKPVEAESVR